MRHKPDRPKGILHVEKEVGTNGSVNNSKKYANCKFSPESEFNEFEPRL